MKEKVNVTGVPETMVQTLYARAKETRKKNVQKKHVRLSDKTRTCFLKKTYVFF